MSKSKKAGTNKPQGEDIALSRSSRSHENDPFFVGKVEEAKAAVKKLIIPDGRKK